MTKLQRMQVVWLAALALGLSACVCQGDGSRDDGGASKKSSSKKKKKGKKKKKKKGKKKGKGSGSKEGASSDGAGAGDDHTLSARGNRKITSFRSAKKKLPGLFEDDARTFYCDCAYEGKKVDLKGCGYEVRKTQSRAERLEWEHVVPASRFGRTFKAWTEGDPKCEGRDGKRYKGRKCAGKASELFEHMEADLYNLRPAIGEVNGDRSSKEMGEVAGEARRYGSCDVEITSDTVEPRKAIRGDVARTYLYMDWAYPGRLRLTKDERARFERWSKDDPPTKAERAWAKRVAKIQGNAHPFLD